MSNSVYKTGRALLVPLAVDLSLLFVLFFILLCVGGSTVERVVLIIIFILLFFIFLELILREVNVANNSIKIKKLFRRKELKWEDITNVDAVIIRKRVYLVLSTTTGFHVLSNVYEKFVAMLQEIVDNIDGEKVEDNVWNLLNHPMKKLSNIILAWFAAIVLLGIIYTRLSSF
jgi:hypothetical protein